LISNTAFDVWAREGERLWRRVEERSVPTQLKIKRQHTSMVAQQFIVQCN
jgi:hypothetical protein